MSKDPAPQLSTATPHSPSGLSQAEAERRLQCEGPNALPSPEHRNIFGIAKEVLEEPMLLLLLLSGSLYLIFGDFKEGLLLFLFALLSIIITIVQETRTERILDSLRTLSNPNATVIRDDQHIHIPATQLVRGDLLLLNEGERISADGLVLEAHDLLIDESLLTGESVPVRKTLAGSSSELMPEPGGEDLPYVFAGSFIVRGSALIEVKATGLKSAIGKIGHSLQTVEREPPRLRQQTNRMVKIFALIGVSVSLATLILYGLHRGDWLEASLAGIAIGMSMLPEELPVVLTVFMAMGAWRISKVRVLTRRAAAIETLGSANVLCSDKTGTLTENKMQVAQLYLPDGTHVVAKEIASAPSAYHALLETAYLASVRNPIDPMERAFHKAHHDLQSASDDHQNESYLIHAFGLRPDLLAVTHLWKMDQSSSLLVAAKGAPEAIADLCNLSSQDRENLHHSIDAMAAKGLRVLGVAQGRWQDAQLPASPHDISFDYLGLIGLSDPIRAHVAEAIAHCQSAGIRVIMITGDYPKTALAIAHDAGLDTGDVITGPVLAAMNTQALCATVAKASIFARIMPEQKLSIVQALKANGDIVAMTGDGVNDAPSLKAAHIGIAMGERGTEVARQAASLILLDDNFISIVEAIKLGRRIYDNIRKAVSFIFAVHIPIAGLALLPLMLGLPPLLGPVHIAFLEMIIDPVCSLVFEALEAEDNIMQRPPRAIDTPLFSKSMLLTGALQGLTSLAITSGTLLYAINCNRPETETRALCFFALVATILGLIILNRSFHPSVLHTLRHPGTALVSVLLAVILALTTTLTIPMIADLFKFGPLHGDDLALVIGAAVAMVIGLEGFKYMQIRFIQIR